MVHYFAAPEKRGKVHTLTMRCTNADTTHNVTQRTCAKGSDQTKQLSCKSMQMVLLAAKAWGLCSLLDGKQEDLPQVNTGSKYM